MKSYYKRCYRCKANRKYKICINEQVKQSQRRARLKRFEREVQSWDDVKLEREMAWMETKWEVMRAEVRRRLPDLSCFG